MRRFLTWLIALSVLALLIWLFVTRSKDASIDLGDRNADVIMALGPALSAAHDWHGTAFVSSMSIISAPLDKESLVAYFYGSGLFQRHLDVLEVTVDLNTGRVLNINEGKGGLEPNYDGSRPLHVSLHSGWREVLQLADSAYGTSFKARFHDASSTVTIENDKWYVSYSSDSSGAYTHITIFDESAHPSIANTVIVNDSGVVKEWTPKMLPE